MAVFFLPCQLNPAGSREGSYVSSPNGSIFISFQSNHEDSRTASAPRVPYVQILVYEEIRNCCLQNIIATSTQSRSRLVGKLYPAGSLRPRLVGKLYPAGSLRPRLLGKLYPAGSLRPRLVGKLYPAGSLRSRLLGKLYPAGSLDLDCWVNYIRLGVLDQDFIHFLQIPR